MAEITGILQQINLGDREAYQELIALIYGELRRLASSLMRGERRGHTLDPTALVNEAFVRLVQIEPRWENRAHFFGAAARAMRRILVEYARSRLAEKRGAGAQRVSFSDLDVRAEDPGVDVLALEEALTGLGKLDTRLLEVVELRYFAGCDLEEIAGLLGVSQPTVKRDWAYARAWLYDFMKR